MLKNFQKKLYGPWCQKSKSNLALVGSNLKKSKNAFSNLIFFWSIESKSEIVDVNSKIQRKSIWGKWMKLRNFFDSVLWTEDSNLQQILQNINWSQDTQILYFEVKFHVRWEEVLEILPEKKIHKNIDVASTDCISYSL